MALLRKLLHPSGSWFWLGVAGLFLMSIALRFWGLTRFNVLVFDEVYFAKYGNDYLNGTPFFDIHPPLGKYLIGLGIWLSRLNPFGYRVVTNVDDFHLATFSYRWLNAFTGSLIPLAVVGVAYQLTLRRSYALIAGLFTAVDGLLLVESRYALINVYLILFGLLGQLCFLIALRHYQNRLWLLLAGIFFGACISVKWNGSGFLLSAYLLLLIAWVVHLPHLQPMSSKAASMFAAYLRPIARSTIVHSPAIDLGTARTPFESLRRLDLRDVVFDLAIVPAIVYRLVWIPHLRINREFDFWQVHKQIWAYNTSLGSGPKEHPYCSTWNTWPLMIRPVGYFYKQVEPAADAVGATQTLYDVHAFGNPVLWWFSTAAILFLVVKLAQQTYVGFTSRTTRGRVGFPAPLVPLQVHNREIWVLLYLVVNYATNYLPWVKITRCAFIYHYMEAAIFAFLAIAWLVDRWLQGYDLFFRVVGVTVVFLILVAFVFWLPIFLGLPLSPEGFQSRMWFKSWY